MWKLFKIIAICFVLLVVAGAATIAFLVRKPAPETICNNLYDLSLVAMNRGAAEAAGKDPASHQPMTREDVELQMKMTLDECVADVERRWERSHRGAVNVARTARCQAAAKSLEEMEDC